MMSKNSRNPRRRTGTIITLALVAVVLLLLFLNTPAFAADSVKTPDVKDIRPTGIEVPTGAYLAGPEDWTVAAGDVVVIEEGLTPLSGSPADSAAVKPVSCKQRILETQVPEQVEIHDAAQVITPDGTYDITSTDTDERGDAVLTLSDSGILVYDGNSAAYYGSNGDIYVYDAADITLVSLGR